MNPDFLQYFELLVALFQRIIYLTIPTKAQVAVEQKCLGTYFCEERMLLAKSNIIKDCYK